MQNSTLKLCIPLEYPFPLIWRYTWCQEQSACLFQLLGCWGNEARVFSLTCWWGGNSAHYYSLPWVRRGNCGAKKWRRIWSCLPWSSKFPILSMQQWAWEGYSPYCTMCSVTQRYLPGTVSEILENTKLPRIMSLPLHFPWIMPHSLTSNSSHFCTITVTYKQNKMYTWEFCSC